MSDEVLNIKVTDADVTLIMNALDFFASAHDGDTGALELHDDLFEQVATIGVLSDIEPTEIADESLTGRTFEVAEEHFIEAGVQAREQMKASSMAAARRTQRFGEFSVETPGGRSEQQKVDVWDANDPKNW